MNVQFPDDIKVPFFDKDIRPPVMGTLEKYDMKRIDWEILRLHYLRSLRWFIILYYLTTLTLSTSEEYISLQMSSC